MLSALELLICSSVVPFWRLSQKRIIKSCAVIDQ